jgi:hypothetical protein
MAYPRACPGCGISYVDWSGPWTFPHITLAAQDGGAPSPWRRGLPGRLLDLRCQVCGTVFRWDYFGRGREGQLGTLVTVLRGPRPGLEVALPKPARGWRREEHRRAS